MNPEDVKLALEHKTRKRRSLNNSQISFVLNNQDTVIVPDLRTTTVADVGGRENVYEEINADIIHAYGLYVFLLWLLVWILVRYCSWYAIAVMLLVCYYYQSAAALLLVPVCYCCWYAANMPLLLTARPRNPKNVGTPTSSMQLSMQPYSLGNNPHSLNDSQSSSVLNNQDAVIVADVGGRKNVHEEINADVIHENNSCKINIINERQQRTEVTITHGQVVNALAGSSCETDSYTNKEARLDSALTVSKASSGAPTSNLVLEDNGYKIIININPGQVINAPPEEDEIATPRRRCKTYHQHDLELKSTRSSYKCSGCKELGFGGRYVCERCPYFLHPDCMYYKETATHDFLEGSIFKFDKGPPNIRRYCDACGMDILGFFYHCEGTIKDLHPCCLNLRKTVAIGDDNFQLGRHLQSKCLYCKSKNKKDDRDKCWCYSLENQNCHIHVYCMKDLLLKCWDGGGGGGGNGAMVLERRKFKVSTFVNLVGKLLEIVLSVLTGNPIPLFTVGVEVAKLLQ